MSVLILDSDDKSRIQLQTEIAHILDQSTIETGFQIPRKNIFIENVDSEYLPSIVLRLFRVRRPAIRSSL